MICGFISTVILSIYTTSTYSKYLLVDIESNQQLSINTTDPLPRYERCPPFCGPPSLEESQLTAKEGTKITGVKTHKFENGQGCFTNTDCKSKKCSKCPLANQCGLEIGKACTNNKDCCSLICLKKKCAYKKAIL